MKWNDFKLQKVATASGVLQARIAGTGPALVLLHGFPQTHLMWSMVAPELAKIRQVICFDLPGYGNSDPPADIEAASKRAMAAQIVEAMESLGHKRFSVAGHDRGGRVAYRMALDHSERVTQLAVLDILPTIEYWKRMDHAFAMKIYHWMFLAQPAPLPEILIGAAPDFYIDHTLASWTKTKDLSDFSADALEAYRAQARDEGTLKAMCDDYRAGESVDLVHDQADFGVRKISCPSLVLWGDAGIATDAATPLDTWRHWCDQVKGEGLDCGHFMAEENPEATTTALVNFFQ